MDDKFMFGLCVGMLGGALLVANSNKAKQIIKDGQEQAMQKVEQLGESKKNS